MHPAAISTYCSALLALQLLASCQVNALPITSKPIESTAENLAWQAWLMLPPEQKSLEKSRKVTPKSIFTLPFRECPPGHQLYEQRCIPTVNIDQSALLTQQLLGFVIGDSGGDADQNYPYDYEDEEMVVYEAPQALGGVGAMAGMGGASGAGAQLPPNPDEPLKFNIFQQKFPTDYEAESASLEGSGSGSAGAMGGGPPMQVAAGEAQSNGSSSMPPMVAGGNSAFMDAFMSFLQRQAANATTRHGAHVATTSSNENADVSNVHDNNNNKTGGDLQSDSSDLLLQPAAPPLFAISEIDAIALPAVASTVTPTSSSSASAEALHRVSLFKDDSAVQLVTSALADGSVEAPPPPPQALQLQQLLQADALLPLTHEAAASATNTNKNTSKAAVEPPSGTTTTTKAPTTPDALATTTEQLQTVAFEKAERSVSADVRADLMAAAEDAFSTTLEPDDTTHMQLDETTIIEARAPAAIMQQELQSVEMLPQRKQQQQHESHFVLKKSKVEPDQKQQQQHEMNESLQMAASSIEATATKPTTTTVAAAAATQLPIEITTATEQEIVARTATAAAATQKTQTIPPTTTTTVTTPAEVRETTAQTTNRLPGNNNNNQLGISVATPMDIDENVDADAHAESKENANSNNNKNNNNDVQHANNHVAAPSEINIEEELRLINALVKGNRQKQPATTPTTTPTTIKPKSSELAGTATAMESGLTTTTAKIAVPTLPTTTTTAKATIKTAEIKKATTLQTTLGNKQMKGNIKLPVTAPITTTTTTTKTIAVAATSTPTPTPEATTTTTTAVAWNKIMPISSVTNTDIITTTTTGAATVDQTSNASAAATTATTPSNGATTPTPRGSTLSGSDGHLISSISSISDSNDTNNNNNKHNASSGNRSNRNSKVSRFNSLSTTTRTTTTPKPTTTIAPQTTTTTTTTAATDTASNPFWWLPIGWSLDGDSDTSAATATADAAPAVESAAPSSPPDDYDYDAGAQSLLLRFWSAFPGNQAKVKK